MEYESNGNMMPTGLAKVSLGSLLLYFFTLSCLLAIMFIGKDVVACHGFFPEMGTGVMGFMPCVKFSCLQNRSICGLLIESSSF